MKPLIITLAFFLTGNLLHAQTSSAQKNGKEEADSLFRRIRKVMLSGKRDSLHYLIDKGISLSTRLNDDTLLCKFYMEKSNAIAIQGDKKSALEYYHIASGYLTPKASYLIKDKYNALGAYIHSVLLNYDSSLHYLDEAEKLNNIHNPYRNWYVNFQRGVVYDQTGLPVEAEKYFWKAYELVKTKNSRTDLGLLLNEFAGFLSRRNLTEKFARILSEYNKFLDASPAAMRNDPIHSMLYVDWNRFTFKDRVKFMWDVKDLLLKKGDTLNAAYANNFLVRFYEDNKQLDDAWALIKQNLSTYKPVSHPSYEYTNTLIAYRILKKMNKHEEALALSERLMKLRDSISSLEQQALVKDLDVKYESQKKEKEIALLNSENELNHAKLLREQEIKQRLQLQSAYKDSLMLLEKSNNSLLSQENAAKDAQLRKEEELKKALNRENNLISNQNKSKETQLLQERKLRSILIGGAALLLICAATILHLYRKQRIKNKVIQKQADELEVLMKEIHHRVKNNMQIVSSLLDLQGNTIKDNQAAEAVKEGKNRVQSMAIIHQHLYQEGNIRGIKMNEYISTLTQNLFSSYNVNPSKISLKTDIEHLNLDVDTVIPIGLIINELVSNSLKYAFEKSEKGMVSISLKEKNDSLELLVKDDGKGFPAGLNIHKNNSFGLQLITAFAQKLKAKLDFYNDNGAAVYMQIKKFRMANN